MDDLIVDANGFVGFENEPVSAVTTAVLTNPTNVSAHVQVRCDRGEMVAENTAPFTVIGANDPPVQTIGDPITATDADNLAAAT